MKDHKLSNKIRFPLALSIGVGMGFFANSMVNNGAFFVGGTGLGTMAALWLIHLAEEKIRSRSSESQEK